MMTAKDPTRVFPVTITLPMNVWTKRVKMSEVLILNWVEMRAVAILTTWTNDGKLHQSQK